MKREGRAAGRGEGGKFGSERGGVGEGEKPKLEVADGGGDDPGQGAGLRRGTPDGGTDRLGRAK